MWIISEPGKRRISTEQNVSDNTCSPEIYFHSIPVTKAGYGLHEYTTLLSTVSKPSILCTPGGLRWPKNRQKVPNISHGSVSTRLRCGGITNDWCPYYKFTAGSVSERNLNWKSQGGDVASNCDCGINTSVLKFFLIAHLAGIWSIVISTCLNVCLSVHSHI